MTKEIDIKKPNSLLSINEIINSTEPLKIAREVLIGSKQGNISDVLLGSFLHLANSLNLDPRKKEIDLVAFDSKNLVPYITKQGLTILANRQRSYKGFQAGIILKTDKGVEFREGTIRLDNEELLGGWCQVFAEGKHFGKVTVNGKDLKIKQWESNQYLSASIETMTRKVAIARALREAFPEDFPVNIIMDGEEYLEENEPKVITPKQVLSDDITNINLNRFQELSKENRELASQLYHAYLQNNNISKEALTENDWEELTQTLLIRLEQEDNPLV